MKTTLNIIPLSAIRDAYAQHEEDRGHGSHSAAQDHFSESINNGRFGYGTADMTLVDVKSFINEWPEYDAAVYNVLSSDDDYKCAEPCYVDLEA